MPAGDEDTNQENQEQQDNVDKGGDDGANADENE
jgi:hypothetical protein